MVVNDFLVEHFPDIVNFNFTADIENEFDDIALGSKDWQKMIDLFYKDFEPTVDKTLKNANRTKGERELGIDPKTNEKVFAKIGRYGPFVQLGEGGEDKPKPKFAKLKQGQLIETITLEESLELLQLPRELGKYEGVDVIVNIGRFGPYVGFNKGFYSIPKDEDPYTLELDRAIEIIKEKKEKDRKNTIGTFEHDGNEIKVLRGRFGPYISYMKNSYKIPKEQDPEKVDLATALEIIKNTPTSKKKRATRKKK
jgi:DNA topoisomerase-1